MLENIDTSLIDWSRAQFALTAIYHWIFVPLTLGLAVIMGIMETVYYRTGDKFWKHTAKFWMKLFGINFAIGVATGLILEFEFGTNWSNYSWFVGDIFGAPLAIEGILAFFMEATFIAVMFFGWDKVSKRFHLASTWLTGLGATISAWWILVANAWMQNPVGMEFNPDTARNEMVDFWAVATSPMAVNKFFHSVLSGWVLAAVFVVGVSCWYLWKNREKKFALASIKIAAWVGLCAAVLSAWTGDGSGYQVAQKQPMKLAAMEGYYQGQEGAGLVAFGILNPDKKTADDGKDAFLFRMEIPKFLSLLAERDSKAFVPGINDLLKGGYPLKDGTTALSAQEKIEKGKTAIGAFSAYRAAKAAGNDAEAQVAAKVLKENVAYFGYGYIKDVNELVPNVPLTFYMFRVMVILGVLHPLLHRGSRSCLQEGFVADALDALGGNADHSAGLSCRAGRLGGCRMRTSAVGHSGYVAHKCRHFQTGCRLRADHILHFPCTVHRYADCRSRHYAESHTERTGKRTFSSIITYNS